MYGALIVDPPDLVPVAQQYVLVGSELFFGPDGASGDYAKMRTDQPTRLCSTATRTPTSTSR